jgi:membrane fusion protein
LPTTPDAASSFLHTDPPHWAARGLAYLLILLFVTIGIMAVVVRVPETVTGPFVLTPVRGTDPVRASRSGNVSQVRVAEGQTVRKGDLVFVIQSVPVGDRSAELLSLETQHAGLEASLRNAKREYDSQRMADDEAKARLQKRLEYLPRAVDLRKEQLRLMEQVAKSYRQLHKEGLVGWADIATRELEINKVAGEQEEFETELKEHRTALEKLRHEAAVRLVQFQEQERRMQEELEKTRIRIAALRSELMFSNKNELSVPAPCDGTLLRLRVKAPGAFVPEGETLCELACDGDRLQADVIVPQAGLGRLKPGQGVKLLYEAFPYQRYGVRYGTVGWVSPASLTGEGEAAFHAFVELADDSITVEGQPRPLKPGMRGRAQVVVGRVPLITYAFEPLRQLRQSVADAPSRHETHGVDQQAPRFPPASDRP